MTAKKADIERGTRREMKGAEEDTVEVEAFDFDVTLGGIMSRGFCDGIIKDIQRRLPHYLNDWTDIFHLKVLAAIFFMFFTSLAPAITFSVLLKSTTQVDGEAQIGTVEVILSTTIAGGIFSVFAGQPMCILGVTGPVSIFTIAVFNISQSLGINFLPFYAWTQIWSAIMHILLAVFNLCELISWVTRYSCETFGVLIGIIYLFTGLEGVGKGFEKTLDVALFQFILAFGAAYMAWQLSSARSWVIGSRGARELIADYGATISVIFFSAVPYMSSESRAVSLETLDVPSTFQPTSGRNWFVDLSDISPGAAFGAIIPGFILTVLFFFDHNVSSLLCQSSDLNLKKGSAYHWDFFIVGIIVLITGLLGIPPTNGLIPQAPLHSQSLARKAFFDINGKRVEKVVHVHEQRITNFMQALLIGIMLSEPFLYILSLVPNATLDGLFLYMGASSFPGNQFAERLFLIVTETDLRTSSNTYLENVPWPTLRNFTLVQALACAFIFGITLTPAAMVFPLLIASLVLLRKQVFPRYLTTRELLALDTSLHKCAPDSDKDSTDGKEMSDTKETMNMKSDTSADERAHRKQKQLMIRKSSLGGVEMREISVQPEEVKSDSGTKGDQMKIVQL